MKSAAVMLCGFLLALAPLFAGQPAACAAPVVAHGGCHCGGRMPCCAARHNASPPGGASVVPTAPQNELSLPPQVISPLPPLTAPAACAPASAVALKPAAPPLYARDCARLI